MIYDFLYRPKNILTELRREQSRLEGLQQMMYPSGIRYDTDKVISSPRDPMPEYAAKVDEILDTIKKLKLEYWNAMDDITDKAIHLDGIEQEVIMRRYVAQKTWNEIALEFNRTERWMFAVHKRAVRNLEKMFPNL